MEDRRDGFYFDVSFEEYVQIPRLSKSTLYNYNLSPRYFKLVHEGSPLIKEKDTASLRKGSQFDDFLSLPSSQYDECYLNVKAAIYPPRFLTKSGAVTTAQKWKSELEEWKAAQVDPVMTPNQHETARKKMDAKHAETAELARLFSSHPDVAKIQSRIDRRQVCILWTDKETGVPLKGLIDGIGKNFAMDIKTSSKSIRKFVDEAMRWGYHWQHVMYQDGALACGLFDELPAFSFLVQETTIPFESGVIELPYNVQARARTDYRAALRGIQEKRYESKYQGYQRPDAPAYILYDLETEAECDGLSFDDHVSIEHREVME